MCKQRGFSSQLVTQTMTNSNFHLLPYTPPTSRLNVAKCNTDEPIIKDGPPLFVNGLSIEKLIEFPVLFMLSFDPLYFLLFYPKFKSERKTQKFPDFGEP